MPDLEAMPALLERPDLAAMSAAWFWHSKELNTFADLGDFIRITKRINGGTNGLTDRQALYEAAKAVLL
jgi:putative chitinase